MNSEKSRNHRDINRLMGSGVKGDETQLIFLGGETMRYDTVMVNA